MPNHNFRAETSVEAWLRGEHEYQFAKNQVTHNADPQSSLTYIVGTEIGNKWHRFQTFNRIATTSNDRELHLQASQQLLKSCAAARGALVWEYALEGHPIIKGSELTWDVLKDYCDAVNNRVVALPSSELLEVRLESAIRPATIEPREGVYDAVKPIFTRLAGLAIVYFTCQQERSGEMMIPKPGTPSGHIESWQV